MNGVRVFGISLDSVTDQALFHEQRGLPFALLSDPDGSAASKYAVLGERGWANRVTFLIDPKGILRAVIDDVDVATHGEQVVLLVEELKG